jgi:UDP-4-amino-4-deoxy-L-arabinose formyltransferase/UDP-glucuronic acid dehydrogenase (UDP-4-keto-hexauronic acid decarboxylating)
MRVALFCEEAAGLRVLQLVSRGPHEPVAVVTSAGSPPWRLAQKLGLQPLPASHVRDAGFPEELARLGADLVLNVHSLHIVPEAVLRVPRYGAYNLHPGPLPRYAGLNAPSWAIYHGETRHGVTLHRMAAGIDTGPVAFETAIAVLPDDTGLTLSLRCAEEGVRLVERLLACDPGSIPQNPQDLGERRYFGRGAPQGGRIDWNETARRLHAYVRAADYRPFSSPWGTPLARLDGRELGIVKTAATGMPASAPPGTLRVEPSGRRLVACADEWLELVRTEPQSGRSHLDALGLGVLGLLDLELEHAVLQLCGQAIGI